LSLFSTKRDKKREENYGNTPLYWASFQGHVDILHLLVENGADLEAQDNDGERALHSAALFGHLPFIQELISRYHVDINARMNDGRTSLWWARALNHSTVIAFLQSNGGI
jgi:ankyrin repeat protein